MMDQIVLNAPPGDGVASLAFSPAPNNHLLVASWDSTTRLYDVDHNFPKATYNFSAACLTCCFDENDGTKGFCGGLDGAVSTLDLTRVSGSGSKSVLGIHGKAVSCLHYCAENNALLSGSWDGSISVWDPRSATSSAVASNVLTPGKVYSVSVSGQRVVVATSDRHILIYDVRKMPQVEQHRESPLRHQTRKVACSLDGRFFAVGSTEGRVAIEYVDMTPEEQAKKYAFKCHRKGDKAYPVNAIAFHPVYGTFATGGCDGAVNVWDGANKKRLAQLPPYPTSIASIAFNHDGSMMAVASSYTNEEGQKDIAPEDNIYVRRVDEAEVRPRQKGA